MKRRKFLKRSSLLLGGSAAWALKGCMSSRKRFHISSEKMDRVGATTVCFRSRFPQTRPDDADPGGPALKLEQVPEFFADKLGVHNVELWSLHFADHSETYCKRIRRAAEKAGSRIINIQLDGDYNLSAPDKSKRKQSIQLVKEWMDRAAFCGAASLRANTGGGSGKFDVKVTGESFSELAEYGKKIGVKILVENHTGYSKDPGNVVAICKYVDSPWCRTLPDFGNMPGNLSQSERNARLGKLMPYAHLISAKGMYFDKQLRHEPYDIGECVRFAESKGFKGIYSAEQWAPKPIPVSDLRATRRIIHLITANI